MRRGKNPSSPAAGTELQEISTGTQSSTHNHLHTAIKTQSHKLIQPSISVTDEERNVARSVGDGAPSVLVNVYQTGSHPGGVCVCVYVSFCVCETSVVFPFVGCPLLFVDGPVLKSECFLWFRNYCACGHTFVSIKS